MGSASVFPWEKKVVQSSYNFLLLLLIGAKQAVVKIRKTFISRSTSTRTDKLKITLIFSHRCRISHRHRLMSVFCI